MIALEELTSAALGERALPELGCSGRVVVAHPRASTRALVRGPDAELFERALGLLREGDLAALRNGKAFSQPVLVSLLKRLVGTVAEVMPRHGLEDVVLGEDTYKADNLLQPESASWWCATVGFGLALDLVGREDSERGETFRHLRDLLDFAHVLWLDVLNSDSDGKPRNRAIGFSSAKRTVWAYIHRLGLPTAGLGPFLTASGTTLCNLSASLMAAIAKEVGDAPPPEIRETAGECSLKLYAIMRHTVIEDRDECAALLRDVASDLARENYPVTPDREGRSYTWRDLDLANAEALSAIAAYRFFLEFVLSRARQSGDSSKGWKLVDLLTRLHIAKQSEDAWLLSRAFDSEEAGAAVAHVEKFDKSGDSVAPRKEPTGEGTREIGQETVASTAPSALRDRFAEASLGDLVEALVPGVPETAIKRLEELIREAQENPPEDRHGFVRSVNRILDAQNLRLQVEGEEHLARLTIKNGSLALLVAGGRGSVGFRRTVSVVEVPEGYALRGGRPLASDASPTP